MDDKQTQQFLKKAHIDDVISVDYKLFLCKQRSVEGAICELDRYNVRINPAKKTFFQKYLGRIDSLVVIPYDSILSYKVKSN